MWAGKSYTLVMYTADGIVPMLQNIFKYGKEQPMNC